LHIEITKTMEKEKKLNLMPYNSRKHNGIIIYCKECNTEMEETVNGFYSPVKFESEKFNRSCDSCLIEQGFY